MRNQPLQIAITQWREKIIKQFFQWILTHLNKKIFKQIERKKKKKGQATRRYGLEVGVKVRCNVIVWCHVSLCIKKNYFT